MPRLRLNSALLSITRLSAGGWGNAKNMAQLSPARLELGLSLAKKIFARERMNYVMYHRNHRRLVSIMPRTFVSQLEI